jgi:hypothetical protein
MKAKHDLKNRYLHLDYRNIQESKSATEDASKCKNCTLDCTLEELAVLRVRENGKRNGNWKLLVNIN